MKKKKSLPKLKAELEKCFNEFIRLRDKDKPCISCGQFKLLQAGHYYPVKGYDGLRFNEHNVNGECSGCNCFNKSHLIGYGDNLADRIGLDKVNNLKLKAGMYKQDKNFKWMKFEIEEKIEYYKSKVKEMKL